jgi:HSP20 family molecular chaperone IbpA
MSVLRFDPFQEFDRLTEQVLSGRRSGSSRTFPIDAYRRGDRFFVHLDLPGIDPDAIELTCEQNVLTVRAERVFETQENDEGSSPSARRASSADSSSSAMLSTRQHRGELRPRRADARAACR